MLCFLSVVQDEKVQEVKEEEDGGGALSVCVAEVKIQWMILFVKTNRRCNFELCDISLMIFKEPIGRANQILQSGQRHNDVN